MSCPESLRPGKARPIPAPAPVSWDAGPPDTPATAPGSGVMTCSCCHLWPDTGAVSPCQISAQNPDAGIETEPTFILLPYYVNITFYLLSSLKIIMMIKSTQ